MNVKLNKKQTEIVFKAVDWFFNSSEQVFQFSGGPGTGKSVVLNSIVDEIYKRKRINIAPMAYTGAASMRMKGFPTAKTIHASLYECVDEEVRDEYGNVVKDRYFNVPLKRLTFRPNIEYMQYKDLIVIDEGGMVPMEMKKDLLDTGKKILVAGDIFQLPPISGTPAFLITGKVEVLTEIMRQAEGSSIVYLKEHFMDFLYI